MKIQPGHVSALTIIAILLTGCGSAGVSPSPVAIATPASTPVAIATPTPTPTPTPALAPTPVQTPTEVPTPVPAPTATPLAQPSDDELIADCAAGTPIPGAAPYGGALHPLVVVQEGNHGDWMVAYSFDIDDKWVNDSWPSPIQLVACIDNSTAVKVDSCGTYVRQPGGTTGELIRYKRAQTVRILVAATGKLLQSQTYYGTTPDCPTNFQDASPPPWTTWGFEPVDDAQINIYVTAVSTQAVK